MTLSAAAPVQAGAFTFSLPPSAQARNPFTSARATMKSQSVAAYCTSSGCCAVVAAMSVLRPAAEATEDEGVAVLLAREDLVAATEGQLERLVAAADDQPRRAPVDLEPQRDDHALKDHLERRVAVTGRDLDLGAGDEGIGVGERELARGHITVLEHDHRLGDAHHLGAGRHRNHGGGVGDLRPVALDLEREDAVAAGEGRDGHQRIGGKWSSLPGASARKPSRSLSRAISRYFEASR